MSAQLLARPIPIVYPESDGKPMADNTKQFRYIVTIHGGLDALYMDDPNVLVVGDLFWYPVEGEPWTVVAPDVMVIFGRPKGDRRSYQQWKEGGIAPKVAWEIMSPNNTALEMSNKFIFYEKYGIEEYYVYDPDRGTVEGYMRDGDFLRKIPKMQDWVSPCLQVRFELEGDDLVLYAPDGRRFESFVKLTKRALDAQKEAEHAQKQAQRAEAEKAAMARELADLKAQLAAISKRQAQRQ